MRKTATVHTSEKGNRVLTLRGSEFGSCIHSHIACIRGLEQAAPAPHLKTLWSGGDASERHQKEALKRWGATLIEDASGWENQSTLKMFDWRQSEGRVVMMKASPDGLVDIARMVPPKSLELFGDWPKSGWHALENKFLGDASFTKARTQGPRYNRGYAWQVSAVCHAYREKYKRSDIGVAFMAQYRGKEGAEERYCLWLMSEPPYTREEVIARCWQIFDAIDSGEWHKCDAEFPCRYPHQPEPIPGSVAAAKVQRYIDARVELDAAHRDLEHLLCGQGGDAVVGGRRLRRVALPALEVVDA